MLQLDKCTINRAPERPVAVGSTITAEGSCLVALAPGGVFGVGPSANNSGEKFAGVSLAQQLSVEYLPKMESGLVVPAGLTVTLAETPVSGTLRVYGATLGTDIAAGNPATTTGTYSISGKVITFHADQEAEVVTVWYRFVPTVLQAKLLQGDIIPGGAAALILDSVTCIESGDIYTSEYDTSKDWSGSPAITSGAGGLFSIGGNVTIAGAFVIQEPTVADPFLGIRIG